MIPLCHAMDDMEVMFLRALLQNEQIPFFVVGENFGSLYPGLQIASYNERRFLVLQDDFDEAKKLIEEHRKVYEPSFENLSIKSKFRILFEFFMWGWFFPTGKKKQH